MSPPPGSEMHRFSGSETLWDFVYRASQPGKLASWFHSVTNILQGPAGSQDLYQGQQTSASLSNAPGTVRVHLEETSS